MSGLLLVAAIFLVGLNMRVLMGSVGPVMPELMAGTGIGADAASLLTMAPILCLGVFGFAAPVLALRFGVERTIAGSLLLLAGGLALRGFPNYTPIFIGTILGSAGLGVAGVLLPSVIKRYFANATSSLTGIYTMALSGGSAAAAGLTVPLANWLDSWSLALAWWAIPALIAMAIWLPYALWPAPAAAADDDTGPAPKHRRFLPLRGDPLAWQVTFYMGLQSALAYCVYFWLAAMLRERGVDAVVAGAAVAMIFIIQLSTSLTAPIYAARRPSQGGVAALAVIFLTGGILGCLYAPLGSLWVWVVVLGLGQGAAFSMGLALIMLRAPNAAAAADLSGMAQGVGYTLASLGPLMAGVLRDWTGGWHATAIYLTCLTALAVGFGWAAGRPLYVQPR